MTIFSKFSAHRNDPFKDIFAMKGNIYMGHITFKLDWFFYIKRCLNELVVTQKSALVEHVIIPLKAMKWLSFRKPISLLKGFAPVDYIVSCELWHAYTNNDHTNTMSRYVVWWMSIISKGWNISLWIKFGKNTVNYWVPFQQGSECTCAW